MFVLLYEEGGDLVTAKLRWLVFADDEIVETESIGGLSRILSKQNKSTKNLCLKNNVNPTKITLHEGKGEIRVWNIALHDERMKHVKEYVYPVHLRFLVAYLR